jgi:hypothetical protein
MNKLLQPLRAFVFALLAWLALFSFIGCFSANAQVVTNDPPFYGPFNAVFLPGGEGLKK